MIITTIGVIFIIVCVIGYIATFYFGTKDGFHWGEILMALMFLLIPLIIVFRIIGCIGYTKNVCTKQNRTVVIKERYADDYFNEQAIVQSIIIMSSIK